MTEQEITRTIEGQRRFFATRKTFDIDYRVALLKRLRDNISKYQDDINAALKQDIGKSAYEAYMCEVGLVLSDIRLTIRHIRRWSRARRVHTHIGNFPSVSRIIPEPYGTVLIMSPWNYPFLLSLQPLIGAVAAGNTVILKPSNYSPHTTQMLKRLIEETFPKDHVSVVTGGREENAALLDQKFDYIFFTGSVKVGKLVMEKASRHLCPTTLELGGKSPCIVDHTANLKLAAKRICFGKHVNVGQTCIAPDYLFVEECVKDEFLNHYKNCIKEMFGDNPIDNNPDYGKIVNKKHFDRVSRLINPNKVIFGGRTNEATQQIEPTILDNVSAEDPVMQEEIFGPILPVMTFNKIEEVEQFVTKRAKPLACYVFTNDKKVERTFMRYISFGGGCINDTINHICTDTMGFGGVGESGMGSYHGKRTFLTFSHEKSILKKSQLIDTPMRYQPYKTLYSKLLHTLLR